MGTRSWYTSLALYIIKPVSSLAERVFVGFSYPFWVVGSKVREFALLKRLVFPFAKLQSFLPFTTILKTITLRKIFIWARYISLFLYYSGVVGYLLTKTNCGRTFKIISILWIVIISNVFVSFVFLLIDRDKFLKRLIWQK